MAVDARVYPVWPGTSILPAQSISAPTRHPAAATATGLTVSNLHSVGPTRWNIRWPGSSTQEGARIAVGATADFTSRRFVSFQLGSEAWGIQDNGRFVTLANGAIRLYLEDSVGNYAGYNLTGSEMQVSANSDPDNGRWSAYMGFEDPRTPRWYIDRDATPDFSSATPIDWSDVVAFEVYFNLNSALGYESSLNPQAFCRADIPLVTGTETLQSIVNELQTSWWTAVPELGPADGYSFKTFKCRALYVIGDHQAAAGAVFSCMIGFQVGDGTTTTNLTDANFTLALQSLWPAVVDHGGRSPGNHIILDSDRWRPIDIQQSASDVLSLTDFIVASAADWQWLLSGSGTATCTRGSFRGYNRFQAAHGSYIDCTWSDCDGPVEVTTASTITRGLIRGVRTGASALRVMGGPGTYSNIDVRLDNASAVADIVVGNGGAGTYALPNIEVPAGYTLKVRNESASAAVVVQVPAGLTTSTSTAGGSITVESAAVEYTLTLTGLLADSEVRLYRDSDDVELAGVESSGTTWSYTYEYGGSAVAATLVIFKESRAPIRLPLSLGAGSTTLPIQQQLDRVFSNPA